MSAKISIATPLLLLVTFLALSGCEKKTATPLQPAVITGLATTQTQLSQIPSTISISGTVHAKEAAILSAQVIGRITQVAVREGEVVRAGQPLLSLDESQMRAEAAKAQASVSEAEQEVQAAQSEASLAESTLKRYALLRERKSVSPHEYEEVERRAQAANARLEALHAQVSAATSSASGVKTILSYSKVRAPFDGVVIARHVDPGVVATPGMPLLEVEKSGTLQLYVTADESILDKVHTGSSVPVVISALSTPSIQGQIANIVPAADPASHSFLIKIDLPPTAGLKSGMFGTIKVELGSRTALLVPQTSIHSHGSLNCIWALDANHQAALRYVTVGEKQGQDIEILSGLSAGETLVLDPGDRELAGKRVEVKP